MSRKRRGDKLSEALDRNGRKHCVWARDYQEALEIAERETWNIFIFHDVDDNGIHHGPQNICGRDLQHAKDRLKKYAKEHQISRKRLRRWLSDLRGAVLGDMIPF